MPALTAAVVAVGSQGRVHVNGYEHIEGVRLVAVADVDLAQAESVAAGARDKPRAFSRWEELLDSGPIDLLSVCTPPAFHYDIVMSAIEHGVRAIHSEKPIALSYGEARAMAARARERGVLVTINHQRRFENLYREARQLIVDGALGELTTLEGYCANLFDWGSHLVDLLLFLTGDFKPDVVFGQIDVATRRFIYGALAETASVTHLHWNTGLNATILTGRDLGMLSVVGNTALVVNGTRGRMLIADGVAELRFFDGSCRRIQSRVDPEFQLEMGGVDHTIIQATADALADLVDCLTSGRTPVLDIAHGLAAAEIIFSTYESSARRGPVVLPLTVDDNALTAGVEKGTWVPVGESFGTY